MMGQRRNRRDLGITSELSALERKGTAVGVLADRLLRTAPSVMYRRYLTAHNLVLVSPFNEEARFW